MKAQFRYLLAGAAVGVIAAATQAAAGEAIQTAGAQGAQPPIPSSAPQTLAPPEPAELSDASKVRDQADIVVTGTLIRGVAPPGTEAVTLNATQIQELGGVTTNDVLAQIPQISNYFNQAVVAAAGDPTQVQTPTIHGLPTLVMLDGHRLASAGTVTTSVDAGIVPKGVLQSIEVVPDGGSAIYGSDAVGGVINMTTKRRFDGVQLDANVGIADQYTSSRYDITLGKAWTTGSIYFAYSYDRQSPLFGRDRPYIQSTPALTQCYPASVSANALLAIPGIGTFSVPLGTYSYSGVNANGQPTAYTNGAAGCNEYTNETISPEEDLNSVFIGFSQDISPALRLDVRAFYSNRNSTSYSFNPSEVATATVPTSNYYYKATPGELSMFYLPGISQSAAFSFAPVMGGALAQPSELQTWGASGELRADVGHGWQIRGLLNYTASYVRSTTQWVDSGLLATALASSNEATALDPYNVAATPESAALAREIDDQKDISWGSTGEFQGRVVADGTLVHIPGGDIKIATGLEVLHDNFSAVAQQLTYNGGLYNPTETADADRTVGSVFGEVEVPVISADNHVPFIHSLAFSVAGRYDYYSDFGGTFNPRYAVSLAPTDWLTFRATYGNSFVAPTLAQEYAVNGVASIATEIPFLLPPGNTTDVGRNVIIVQGGNPNLRPQTARTWTLGGDLKVPFVKGLQFGLTYYNAYYNDEIATVPFANPSLFYTPTYASFYVHNPTLAQAQAIVGNTPASGNGFTSLQQLYNTPGADPAYVVNDRFANLSKVTTRGFDFTSRYSHAIPYGTAFVAAAGNYVLRDNASGSPGQPFTDQLTTMPRYFASVSTGAKLLAYNFNITLLHTGGYGITPGAGDTAVTGQTSVKGYNAVNAFVSYTVKGYGYLDDTLLSLNVNNLFNALPSRNTSVTYGYSGGSVIGRTFELGLRKKF